LDGIVHAVGPLLVKNVTAQLCLATICTGLGSPNAPVWEVEFFLSLYSFLRYSKKYMCYLRFCKNIPLPPCGMAFGPYHTAWEQYPGVGTVVLQTSCDIAVGSVRFKRS
jgi:hypothetical protein